MSQPTYTFSVGTNNNVAAEMMDANVRVKAELDRLHSDLQASLRLWQTPTSKAQYEARKKRWDTAANQMPASLEIASIALQNITRRMTTTEDAITDSWS